MVAARLRSLQRDERAVAMVEFIVVLVPLLTIALSSLELCRYAISALMLQRAAGIAVRACAVIQDQPLHCDSNNGQDDQNTAAQHTQITQAAQRAILPLTAATLTLESAECTTVKDAKGKLIYPGNRPVESDVVYSGPDTVDVVAEYHCVVPLARQLVCRNSNRNAPEEPAYRPLQASAQYGHQGARYDCSVGNPATLVHLGD